MKKLIFSVLLIVGIVNANSMRDTVVQNWNGYRDTVSITDTLDSATVYYSSRSFKLTDYENIRINVKCDDTTAAGFANDSVNFVWGYQTGSATLDTSTSTTNTSPSLDTIWDSRVTVDTMVADSFGVSNVKTYGTDGVITQTWGTADTSSVSGFATMSHNISPEWDCVIRFWVMGIGNDGEGATQTSTKGLKLYFELKNRVYKPTRRR